MRKDFTLRKCHFQEPKKLQTVRELLDNIISTVTESRPSTADSQRPPSLFSLPSDAEEKQPDDVGEDLTQALSPLTGDVGQQVSTGFRFFAYVSDFFCLGTEK